MGGSRQAHREPDGRVPRALAGVRLSHVWAVVAVAVPVIVVATTPLVTLDLAYQIRAGNIMLSTGHLLRTDVLTFSAFGRPWLNQQWGAQLVLAGVYRLGGWLGLVLLRGLLMAAVLTLLYLACRVAGSSRRVAALLTFGAAFVMAGGFQLRAQLLGMLCFAAVLLLVADRSSHPGRLWLALPIVVLWANLHGSFFLAPILFGLAWIEDRSQGSPGARRTLIVGVGTILASLVNPFGLRVWSYVSDISTSPLIRRSVEEWQPPSLRIYAGVTFFASVVLVSAYLARRGRPTPWPALLALGVFFAIGLTSVRGVFWWAMEAPVVIAGLTRTQEPRSEESDPASSLNVALVVALMLITIGAFVRWLPYTSTQPPERLLSFAPSGITDELRRTLQPGERLFDAQEWGSWFELALPNNPVLVDSRWEVVPEDVWRRYGGVSNGQEGWQSVLDAWNVRVVVAARDQQQGLIPRIAGDPGWRLLYKDDDGLIFIRR
jgi:hypothetical protein